MSHLLPVTGRRQRPAPEPWEERARSPYLTPNEELQRLIEQVPSMPKRTYYLWNRDRPFRAVQVRSREVTTRARTTTDAALVERLRHGVLAVPVAQLERQVNPPDDSFRPLAPTPHLAQPARRPNRGR